MAVLWGRELEDLLAADVDEVAMLVLERCRRTEHPNRWNVVNEVRTTVEGQGQADQVDDVAMRIVEAWQWLRNEGLLAPSITQTSSEWEVVTRAGRAADAATYLAETRASSLLRSASMDAELRAQVMPLFRRGQHDLAVLAAMRLVEIRVREAADVSIEEDVLGVHLMKEAFKVGGVLDDPVLQKAEREGRMALFWGSIAVFKNPSSHRIVNVEDPQEAAEAVLLANGLLRLVERSRRGRDEWDALSRAPSTPLGADDV